MGMQDQGDPFHRQLAMTKAEYEAWVEEHDCTPTWGRCRLESHPGAIRPHHHDLPVS